MLTLIALALAAGALAPEPWPRPGFQRGVVLSSWDGTYPHREAWEGHLAKLQSLGVQWIEVLTFAHQPDLHAPTIRADTPGRWPAAFVDAARARGFRIFLKPDVWSRQFYAPGSKLWRGDIEMRSDADWAAWFAEYERFLLEEARQAAAHGVEMFSVGLEYVRITRTQEARWRALIAKVRAVYPGLVTYSADGNQELDHVAFWDALDVIGVNAYFELSKADRPSGFELARGWLPHLARVGAVARRFGKPVVLTEAGFPSVVGSTRTPWRWPSAGDTSDVELQARAYESLMAACTSQDWCRGVYWWKWYEMPERHIPHAIDYSPEGKPAEAVLGTWYRVVK